MPDDDREIVLGPHRPSDALASDLGVLLIAPLAAVASRAVDSAVPSNHLRRSLPSIASRNRLTGDNPNSEQKLFMSAHAWFPCRTAGCGFTSTMTMLFVFGSSFFFAISRPCVWTVS
jgi:hypothetical protein